MRLLQLGVVLALCTPLRAAWTAQAQGASDEARARPKSPWRGFRGEGFPEMREAWDTPAALPLRAAEDPRVEAAFRRAERNARQANEAFFRSRRFVDGWLAHADPATGLIPVNLQADHWNARDAAADNYPFMVLTAAMTDRPLLEGRMLDMLRTERRLTCRVNRLPDAYSFSKQGWLRAEIDHETVLLEGAEYVKDGLLPITEWLGPSPWSERAIGIIDDIWEHARVETPFGRLPTLNFEINGNLLQACSRLFWLTGEKKYLERAIRLGDYYLLGDHHPTRDMERLELSDHSCEVLNGLSELYVACAHAAPEKRAAYRQPLHAMYDRLLEIARNEHGLFYREIDNRTGEHGGALTDNWGYNYYGIHAIALIDGTASYRDAVRHALGNLKEHYTGRGGMHPGNPDSYADSIEGAITLFAREPIPSAAEWIDSEIRTLWSMQHPDGIIRGCHSDGNFARTSLLYALWKTQGVVVEPWRADVRFGAVQAGDALYLSIIADEPWYGRLVFDRPRHETHMHLPLDYPRLNHFPEWFTTEGDRCYLARNAISGEESAEPGRRLWEGVPIALEPGVELRLILGPTTTR
jgi:hypothetical protein